MLSRIPGNTLKTFALATLMALALSACGGGSTDSPAPAPPPPAGNVGPGGATVTSADGKASLSVPAGAVSSTIQVGLAAAASGFTADPQLIAGTTYQLTTPDAALGSPATLSIEIPAAALAATALEADAHTVKAQGVFAPIPGQFNPIVISCSSDDSGCWFSDVAGTGCDNPAQYKYVGGNQPSNRVFYPVILGYDSNFTSPDTITFPGSPFTGPASYCAKTTPPVPQIVSTGGLITGLATTFNPATRIATAQLPALKANYFGAILDVVPPTLTLSSLITPATASTSTIKLTATATDNRAVTRVTFARMTAFLVGADGKISITTTPLAQLTAPPYEYTSSALAFSQLYGKAYIVCAFDAANNQTCKSVVPIQGTPSISAFTVTPSTLPYGGGTVTLAWTAADATTVSLNNGIGDVSGQTSTTATVTASTPMPFVLTAHNANGDSTASATVTIAPQPAPVITSFTASPASLPAGGGSVTLSWTTSNANTLSIDNSVGTVTGSSKVVTVTANTTFTLLAANSTTSVTAPASVVVATPGDRYVDPVAGSDAAAGTQAAPYKTISKAMTTGTPVNVYLADGVYDTSTQTAASIAIPDGVTLRALNAGSVTLRDLSLNYAAGGTLSGVTLDAGTQLTAAAATGTPTLTLSGVRIHSTLSTGVGGASLQLGGSVHAVMDPGTLAGGVYTVTGQVLGAAARLTGSSQLTIVGGSFIGSGADNIAEPFQVNDAARLVLDGVTIRNVRPFTYSVIGAAGGNTLTGASVTLQNQSVIDGFDASQSNAVGPAISLNSGASLVIDNSRILNGTRGIIGNGLVGSSIVVRNGSSFTGLASGLMFLFPDVTTTLTINGASVTGSFPTANALDIRGPAAVDITGLTVSGYMRGASFSTPSSLKVRNSSFTGNSTHGMELILAGGVVADLGTSGSPGGNTFTGNGTGLYVPTAGTVNVSGNTWIASQQGADAQGKFTVGTVKSGPQTGQNFTTVSGLSLAF